MHGRGGASAVVQEDRLGAVAEGAAAGLPDGDVLVPAGRRPHQLAPPMKPT
jgi:hypothetical protein